MGINPPNFYFPGSPLWPRSRRIGASHLAPAPAPVPAPVSTPSSDSADDSAPKTEEVPFHGISLLSVVGIIIVCALTFAGTMWLLL